MSRALGLDTSNYKTSAAWFDGTAGENAGRLLEVPAGSLGLRQSEALFQHVRRLPAIVEELGDEVRDIVAVGASTQPRRTEDSYMPCFLAGSSQGQTLARVLGVPFYPCSHQQGHIAAAAWSAGRMDLLDTPHLAWHLSGGTTELLRVEPEGLELVCRKCGGTTDLAAGQLIDRAGQRLGLAFPAGPALEALAEKADRALCFSIKTKDGFFSLSGMENQLDRLLREGETPANVARFVLNSLADAVVRATRQVMDRRDLPVLCSGGVAANRLLRSQMEAQCGAIFAAPRFAGDNALGVAILAHRRWEALS
ncbi:MAG: DNA-binding protein [Oscillospiraceae bacterium]|nr:DNA-binding protein [Oscillospiraceae bacterium]